MIRAYVIFADTAEPTKFHRSKGCKAAVVEVLTLDEFRNIDRDALIAEVQASLSPATDPIAVLDERRDEIAEEVAPRPAHDPADPDGWRADVD